MRRDEPLKKLDAIRMCGGTTVTTARLIGVTKSAVSQWPDPLPPRIADRVYAALYRQQQERSTQAA